MEIILPMIVFVLINLWFIHRCNVSEDRRCHYDTTFCRDVRAQLGMFAYKSKVEATRERLSCPNSRF
jgi:hypothetical protein